jgi:hypothetical protein
MSSFILTSKTRLNKQQQKKEISFLLFQILKVSISMNKIVKSKYKTQNKSFYNCYECNLWSITCLNYFAKQLIVVVKFQFVFQIFHVHCAKEDHRNIFSFVIN